MSATTTPSPADPTRRLPASVHYLIVHRLRRLLPPALSDGPEDFIHQLETAISEIGTLNPANAAEALLATRYVAFSAHAEDCLRLALEAEANARPEQIKQCRNQAAAMARQASGQFNMLMRLQNQRRKLEKDTQAHGRAAWTEHCTTGLLAMELAEPTASKPATEPPPPPTTPQPTAQPPAPEPIAEPPASKPHPPPQPVEAAEPAPLTEAERYAVLYPDRAALIRRLGRVPDDDTLGPPGDDLVQALLTAGGPIFTKLDRRFAHTSP